MISQVRRVQNELGSERAAQIVQVLSFRRTSVRIGIDDARRIANAIEAAAKTISASLVASRSADWTGVGKTGDLPDFPLLVPGNPSPNANSTEIPVKTYFQMSARSVGSQSNGGRNEGQ